MWFFKNIYFCNILIKTTMVENCCLNFFVLFSYYTEQLMLKKNQNLKKKLSAWFWSYKRFSETGRQLSIFYWVIARVIFHDKFGKLEYYVWTIPNSKYSMANIIFTSLMHIYYKHHGKMGTGLIQKFINLHVFVLVLILVYSQF